MPFSPEYRDLIPNEALLREVQRTTGGRWLDGPAEDADAFNHDLPPSVAKRPAWTWVLAWIFLPVFLLDVAVRRLASWLALSIAVELVILTVLLFGLGMRHDGWGIAGAFILAELVGWTIRFRYIGILYEMLTHGVTALAQAGDRSAASLEQLKDARERVRDELEAEKSEGLTRLKQETGPASPSRAKSRFDAGDAGRPAGDLDQALGGAKASTPKGSDSATAGSGEGKEDRESMTSRLLRAKKRKKQDGDEDA